MLSRQNFTVFGAVNSSVQVSVKAHSKVCRCLLKLFREGDKGCITINEHLDYHKKMNHNIIIASETFEYASEIEVGRLAVRLKSFTVSVVMFYRLSYHYCRWRISL